MLTILCKGMGTLPGMGSSDGPLVGIVIASRALARRGDPVGRRARSDPWIASSLHFSQRRFYQCAGWD